MTTVSRTLVAAATGCSDVGGGSLTVMVSCAGVKLATTVLPMPAVRVMSPVRTSEPVPLVAMVSSAPSLKLVMMVSPTHGT